MIAVADRNKATVTQLIDEVWNKKKPESVNKYFSVEFATSTPDGMLYGPQGYLKIYHTYCNAFPDCSIKVADLLAEEDQVVVRFVFKGTHRGELMGLKPTGKTVSTQGITIMRLTDGQITEQQVVWDTLSMLEQIQAITLDK